MFCTKCGMEIQEGDAFCSKCGAPVGGTVVPPASAVLQPEPKKKRKGGLVIFLVLLIIVALAAVGAVVYLNMDSYKYKSCMKQAEDYLAEEEYEDAESALEDALDIKEDDEDAQDMLVDVYLEWAEVCLEEGNLEAAGELYEKVLEIDEDNKKANKWLEESKEEADATSESGDDKTEAGNEKDEEAKYDESVAEDPDVKEDEDILTDVDVKDDEVGKVLNIYCWSEELKNHMIDYYPGYIEVDARTGAIGDVTVKWTITPTQDNQYQNNLDMSLLGQADAAVDDRVDLFLVEQDYAHKYVDTYYTMTMADLGIMSADIENQYKYTWDVVTDSHGDLKGVAWQINPCVMYYNRNIALEVFGTDDPAEVQKYVQDWSAFVETSKLMVSYGYDMVSSVYDTYRIYSQNVTSPWVEDGMVNIDTNIQNWVNDSKYLVDIGAAGSHFQWSDKWLEGFYPEEGVFCYFGPNWLLNYCMNGWMEGSVAYTGDWVAVEGPQSANWGGIWLCAATGTDNEALVKEIMLQMTANEDNMYGMLAWNDDMVNNKPVMEAMAADANYSNAYLGGQNPIGVYSANAEKIDLSNITYYDADCNEAFMEAFMLYFEGSINYEDAIERFYNIVIEKHPELIR